MDDDELDETLNDIQIRTARMDERTEHILTRLDKLRESHEDQDKKIGNLEDRVNRHGMVLGGIIFSVTTAISALASWVAGLIHL